MKHKGIHPSKEIDVWLVKLTIELLVLLQLFSITFTSKILSINEKKLSNKGTVLGSTPLFPEPASALASPTPFADPSLLLKPFSELAPAPLPKPFSELAQPAPLP